MIEITCPATSADISKYRLFVAGGISNCSDWQNEFINILQPTDLILFNPRRKDFDINDPKMTVEQINWEYTHLQTSDAIAFWFPPETMCPITLFELGSSLRRFHVEIFVGIHPDYKRRMDLEIQIPLVRPEIQIVYSVKELAQQVINKYAVA